MTWKERYQTIFNRIETILKGVASIKTVSVGGALRLEELPLALVTPRETSLTPAAMGTLSECRLTFDVLLFIRETEPGSLLDDIVPAMGDALDTLNHNTLDGTVDDLYPILFAPGEITYLNKLYYGGLIRFEAVFTYPL